MEKNKLYLVDKKLNASHESKELCVIGELAVVKGDKGFILTPADLVHELVALDKEAVLDLYEHKKSSESGTSFSICPKMGMKISLTELEGFVGEEITDLKKWVHYFGIKQRVESNYRIFQKSCKEAGIVLDFPKWD